MNPRDIVGNSEEEEDYNLHDFVVATCVLFFFFLFFLLFILGSQQIEKMRSNPGDEIDQYTTIA